MPRTQVAHVPTIRLAPGNPSAIYRVLKGVKLEIRLEAEDDASTVSLQVSPDGTTWAATTANDNGQALTSAALVAGGTLDFSVNIRHQRDNYIRWIVVGAPVTLELRGEEKLDIVQI